MSDPRDGKRHDTDAYSMALGRARVDLYNDHLQRKEEPPPRDAWAILAELLDSFESMLRMSADDTKKALEELKRRRP
jgi:hypothetical protein